MSDVTAGSEGSVVPEVSVASRQILNPYFLLARIRSLATSNAVLAVAILILAGCQVWTLLHPKQMIFFGTSRSGDPVRLYPLNQPIYAQSRIFRFATDATDEAYSVNFVNFRHQFTRVSRKFTPAGWRNRSHPPLSCLE